MSRNSLGRSVTGLRDGCPGHQGSIAVKRKKFTSSPKRPDHFWNPPSLLLNGPRASFLRDWKAGAWSWQLTPSDAEVTFTSAHAFEVCTMTSNIAVLCDACLQSGSFLHVSPPKLYMHFFSLSHTPFQRKPWINSFCFALNVVYIPLLL
jgi:hypothetical protein